MVGGAGIDAVSSAQSRWVGSGVGYGSMGPGRGWTRAGGRETVMVGVMAGVGSGWGMRAGVDGVVGEAAGVWDIGGSETDGVDHFSGWVGERKVLGHDVVNTMLFFCSRLWSLSRAAVGSETAHLRGVWGIQGG